jgi:hypothetical protein
MAVNLQGKTHVETMRQLIFTILASLLMCGATAQEILIDNQYYFAFQWQVSSSHLFNGRAKTMALPFQKDAKRTATVPSGIRADAYIRQMAWSCRQEWKLEQATRLPLRLRLGSKDQVDWLEGKNGSYLPGGR